MLQKRKKLYHVSGKLLSLNTKHNICILFDGKFRENKRVRKLTRRQRMTQAAAPGTNAYQKFKWWNFTPSMNINGKLAAVIFVYLLVKWIREHNLIKTALLKRKKVEIIYFWQKIMRQYSLPGGWLARAMTIKAMEAASATLLPSQPGPKAENATTPMAAQPIWAKNMLYFWKM